MFIGGDYEGHPSHIDGKTVSLNDQGEITIKVCKQELSFLYATHHHDLFYITMKYHEYILKCIQATERTRNCI